MPGHFKSHIDCHPSSLKEMIVRKGGAPAAAQCIVGRRNMGIRTHRMCKRLSSTSLSRDDRAFRTWHCRQIACTSFGHGIFASPFLSHTTQGRLEWDTGKYTQMRSWITLIRITLTAAGCGEDVLCPCWLSGTVDTVKCT